MHAARVLQHVLTVVADHQLAASTYAVELGAAVTVITRGSPRDSSATVSRTVAASTTCGAHP
jgi:hypothetical protein